jgi:uncharacterized tellurite resistance protein B-like protein
MQSATVDYIDNTSTLNTHIVINRIVELIVADIKSIPEYIKLQRSMDLVLRLCLLIENLVFENAVKSKQQGFKKDIAIKVFNALGWNTNEHIDFLSQSIEFLHSSDKIKRVKLVKRLWAVAKKVFVKNVNHHL